MNNSMYSAMFGAMSNEIRMNMTANNLANVHTAGYKKDTVTFQDAFLRFANDYIVDAKPYLRDEDLWPRPDVLAKPRLAAQQTDFTQGHLQQTGNPLDFAITGDGFFKVRTQEGGEFYTRNGRFLLDPEGRLITEQGFAVIGQGGEITIPPQAEVVVDSLGRILVNNEQIEALAVVRVDDPTQMEKVGANLYQGRGGRPVTEIQADDVKVNQGYLEASNVEVVTEMVGMIETQRSFEMYTKMIQSSDQTDRDAISKVGRVM